VLTVYYRCSERSYDKSKFRGSVQDFPFDDHHPPSFEVIGRFCLDVDSWLKQDTNHVAVVHCKAGKVCMLSHLQDAAKKSSSLKFFLLFSQEPFGILI